MIKRLAVVLIVLLGAPVAWAGPKEDCANLKGDAAISACDLAIRQDPKAIDSYFNRGLEYAEKGDHARAISDYTIVVKLNPEYWKAYLARGISYQATGRSSPFWEDHNMLGKDYVRQKKFDLAASEYTKAMEINPQHPWPWLNRCEVYAIQNKLDVALSDCNKSLSLQTVPEAKRIRGIVYIKKAQLHQAIKDFDAVLSAIPDFAEALYARGVARRKLGDTTRGLADIEAAKAIDADVAASFATYGISP